MSFLKFVSFPGTSVMGFRYPMVSLISAPVPINCYRKAVSVHSLQIVLLPLASLDSLLCLYIWEKQ